MRNSLGLISVVVAVMSAGCMQRDIREEETEPFSTQAMKGAVLFTRNCAKCHGAMGQGTEKAPRLVGMKDGALPLEPPASRQIRTMRFVTVADMAGFVVKNMPRDNPGALAEADYFRILAFALRANGVDLDGQHLDMALAEKTVIPRPETPPPATSVR